MKIILLLLVMVGFLFACNKASNSSETIAPDDLIATTTITSQLSNMNIVLSNLKAATNMSQQFYFHHPYPNHPNDSLVTSLNNRHHTDCNHHPGHPICHHHTIGLLHTIHNLHHP